MLKIYFSQDGGGGHKDGEEGKGHDGGDGHERGEEGEAIDLNATEKNKTEVKIAEKMKR